ncbi:MAG: acyl-CoA thioesterase [Prevotella sp.]|nr:acyl-CoA thioesterase [Prevotella sp.]
MEQELKATKELTIRFSEVDSMQVVWHGCFVTYFEDAREYFGELFGLSYNFYIDNGYFAPIVELNIQYKKAIRYGMKPQITITYHPTVAAKIVFDYEIVDTADGSLIATGRSVQVFMNKDYELVWTNPDFYLKWKEQHGIQDS